MTDTTTMNDKAEKADEVADMLRGFLNALEARGIPRDCVLAGAHAEIVAMMFAAIGREMTVGCCEQAAERLRLLRTTEERKLAATTPAGRA